MYQALKVEELMDSCVVKYENNGWMQKHFKKGSEDILEIGKKTPLLYEV